MKSFLVLLMFFTVVAIPDENVADIGRLPTPTVKVRNIFLTIGDKAPEGVVHWTGDLVITDASTQCSYLYKWKNGLKEEKKECPKKEK